MYPHVARAALRDVACVLCLDMAWWHPERQMTPGTIISLGPSKLAASPPLACLPVSHRPNPAQMGPYTGQVPGDLYGQLFASWERRKEADALRAVQGEGWGEDWAGGQGNNHQSSEGCCCGRGTGLFHMSPGGWLTTSGGREKLEKADIRSLKNSNSPGFLTTMCQVMSPYVVVQNVQAEAERSLSEERSL